MLGIQSYFNIQRSVHLICSIAIHQNRNHRIIWLDGEKAFEKVQYAFMIKSLRNLGIQEHITVWQMLYTASI